MSRFNPAEDQLLLNDSQPLGPFGRSVEWQWTYTKTGNTPHKIGPSFTDLTEAQKYGDYLRDPKGHPYRYPTGAV